MRKLSIIIPAYNEENTIEEIIRKVVRAPALSYEKEIIVIDNGSNDGTSEILDRLKSEFNFILLKHPENLGKGGAVKSAVKYITGGLVLIQDADLEYDPNDYEILLRAFSKENPIVYGSRNLKRKEKGSFLYFLGGKLLTVFFNILFGAKLTDIMTCYKLFRADIFKGLDLEEKGFGFEEEASAKIIKKGYRIKEIPIRYYPRKFSEGKKIRFRDGFIGIWKIIKYRI